MHAQEPSPAPTRTRTLVIVGISLLVAAVALTVWFLALREPDLSPQTMIERLEVAGIEGCRSADDATVSCVDVAGVAYFEGVWIDGPSSAEEVLDQACDESALIVLYAEGQAWFGRIRAHPGRASDLAAALGTTQRSCPRAR